MRNNPKKVGFLRNNKTLNFLNLKSYTFLMLEFIYSFVLVRLGGNFFRHATRSPQDASKVIFTAGATLTSLYVLGGCNVMFDKNFNNHKITELLTMLPMILAIVLPMFYASNILNKVSTQRFEESDMQIFKKIINGFLAVALIFYVFVVINVLFGIVFLFLAFVWLIGILVSFGVLLHQKSFAFEQFVGVPYYFFVWENNFFNFFGTDTLSFGIMLGFVVVLLPFVVSLWIIFAQKSLLKTQ